MSTLARSPLASLEPNPPGGASASGLLKALKVAGVTHVVTVPDLVQWALHDALSKPGAGIQQVFACAEDQALTLATGLYIGGAKPAVLVQNQGFFKCLNTLRATCVDVGVPTVFLVGQFGREAENIGQPTSASRRSMVRFMEPLLGTFGMRHWSLSDDSDLRHVAEAFDHAWTERAAAVLMVDRYLTWN